MNQFENPHTKKGVNGVFNKINKMPFGKALQGLALMLSINTGMIDKAKADTTPKNTIEIPTEIPSTIEGLKKYSEKLIANNFPDEFQQDIYKTIMQVIDKMKEEGASNQKILEKVIGGLKNIHRKLPEIKK